MGNVRPARLDGSMTPVGVAAHDIEKGDLIEYNPLENTRDILIDLKGDD